MADPYQPMLTDFVLSDEEQAAIIEALNENDPWGYAAADSLVADVLKSAKKKILDHHLERHHHHCCYCRKSLQGEGHFVTDREHILPKGNAIFKPYCYTIWNLAAACKRCNMQFKGKKTTFLNDAVDTTKFELSDNYQFVHPNFDRFEDHIVREATQRGTAHVIAFVIEDTAKARYTYEFFRLDELERASFDEAQGRQPQIADTTGTFAARELIEKYNQ